MTNSTIGPSPAAPGDIVLAFIPFGEAKEEGKVRPCLVVQVLQEIGSAHLTIAYGTSQAARGPIHPWELSIGRNLEVGSAMEDSGLRRPTEFILTKCYVVPAESVQRIGRVHPSIYGRLEKAIDAVKKRGITPPHSLL